MNPLQSTRPRKSSLVVKKYSRPCSSPALGARVVSRLFIFSLIFFFSFCVAEAGWFDRDVREIENPKVSGTSLNSLLRRVDFPAPEGPDTTTGRNFWTVEYELVIFFGVAHAIGLGGVKRGEVYLR